MSSSAYTDIYNDTQDNYQPHSIEEGISLMSAYSTQRALSDLRGMFSSYFSDQELLAILQSNRYSTQRAAAELRHKLHHKHVHSLQIIKSPSPEHSLKFIEFKTAIDHVETFVELKDPKPRTVALEFCMSPKYQNSPVPVFFIPDEVLIHIFSFFGAYTRAGLSSVCRSWNYIDKNSFDLYKRDCLEEWKYETSRPDENVFPSPLNHTEVLWGNGYPLYYIPTMEYLESFKGWRNMWIKRPRIRMQGVYISKTKYCRQGQTEFNYVQPMHEIVFYRYFRFYPDYSVCCLTTSAKPPLVMHSLGKETAEVRLGEWAGNKSEVVVHLLAKSCVYTYNFKIGSTVKGKYDVLICESITSRSLQDLESNDISVDNKSCPKYFRFFQTKVKHSIAKP